MFHRTAWIILGVFACTGHSIGYGDSGNLISDFDDGFQGWSKVEPFGGTLLIAGSGGNPGGFLTATDTAWGGNLFARHPMVFNFDANDVIVWDEYLYGNLPPQDSIGPGTLAVLFGADGTIFHQIEELLSYSPTDTWTTREVILDSPGDWYRMTGTASFSEVLQNARIGFSMDISTRSTGVRESGIDNIRLTLAAYCDFSSDGDYSDSGIVDAADYTIWRDSLGESGFRLPADGNGDGFVGLHDYDLWKTNFGQSTASGSGADNVPEPTALLLALLALAAVLLRVRCG
jgi:hypothetical protein